ncbi:T9SS type A sorting domain-containing protein [Flavobacterium sp.]|uniref:T9SS type A sorting domain-containing protein n=1 Tax=Flavobacterium sp. TaxID=239 RepID=UPI003D1109E6
MKRKLLSICLFAVSLGYSQQVVFQDDFESYTDFAISGIGNWQTLDLDLLDTYTTGLPDGSLYTWNNAYAPMAFQVFNPAVAGVSNATTGDEVRNFDPKSGVKYMGAWGGVPLSNGQTANVNNDWLISPVINLTGATGSALSLWVKSLTDAYGIEDYKIGVYVGTGTPTAATDFTIISGANALSAPFGVWEERVQNLSAYDGQKIRVGIQYVSPDRMMLMVDDFQITAATLSNNEVLASQFSVLPNPAKDQIRISKGSDFEISNVKISDLNGRVVKTISGNVEVISLEDLTEGMYMMTIQSPSGIATKKIVKN